MMEAPKFTRLAAGVILGIHVAVLAAAPDGPCKFPAIFNFGDSNSDTGGLSAAFWRVPSPHGETFFGKPVGRYCNGRLMIDFIAESFGFPYLSPYLDSMGTNFSRGVNFATAGSTIRRQNTSFFKTGYSPFSLDVQLWQFSQFKNRSQEVASRGSFFEELMPKDDYFSKALYTFDIGQNDLTAGYFLNMSTEDVKDYVPDLIDQFVAAVKGIYKKGGRTFWIHNTGPFGCLPYVLTRVPILASQVDDCGCGTPFNEVARLFNSKLEDAVIQLREDLPLAAFTYVDVYTNKYSLICHARNYGFELPLVTCCGHDRNKYNFNMYEGCGSTNKVNGTAEVLVGKSCKHPSKRIIWDGYHYTEAANKWVFDRISGGSFSDPHVSLSMACHANEHR